MALAHWPVAVAAFTPPCAPHPSRAIYIYMTARHWAQYQSLVATVIVISFISVFVHSVRLWGCGAESAECRRPDHFIARTILRLWKYNIIIIISIWLLSIVIRAANNLRFNFEMWYTSLILVLCVGRNGPDGNDDMRVLCVFSRVYIMLWVCALFVHVPEMSLLN